MKDLKEHFASIADANFKEQEIITDLLADECRRIAIAFIEYYRRYIFEINTRKTRSSDEELFTEFLEQYKPEK